MKDDMFSQFQLKEYENISQAHFKTNEWISGFYRYYLTVMAISITVLTLGATKFPENEYAALLNSELVIAFLLGMLGIFGVGVLMYIEGLRLDAVLYARVVNSVRAHFFSAGIRNTHTLEPLLPIDRSTPSFKMSGAHLPIFVAAAMFNSFYFVSSALLFTKGSFWSTVDDLATRPAPFFLFVAFILLVFLQWRYSQYLVKHKSNWVDSATPQKSCAD